MNDEETYLTADGFEDAFLGVAHPWQNGKVAVAIYDRDKCLTILMNRDDLDYEEAVEFFEFNVCGAYVGEQTPIFVSLPIQY